MRRSAPGTPERPILPDARPGRSSRQGVEHFRILRRNCRGPEAVENVSFGGVL